MILFPISNKKAKTYFKKYSAFRGDFDLAIAAWDGKIVHGVIALTVDGEEFRKAHIWTDGNALVGSLLYGAAWRTAMALGYRQIWT